MFGDKIGNSNNIKELQIGKNIKRIRTQQGLSLRKLAELSGVGSTTLFDIEKGNSSPTINTLASIATGLEIDMQEFFEPTRSRGDLMRNNVGNRIRQLRNERGYSTYDLSEKAGVPQSTISKLENNKRRFDVETLSKIADGLDVSTARLLGESTENILVTIPREDFKELSNLLLDESLEENNNILVFIQDGSIKFGIDRTITQVETIAEFYPEEE